MRPILLIAATLLALALTVPAAPLLQQAPAAECAGDECQPPSLPPDDPIPGTAVVNGPPNPPVHYPKVHKKHHKPRAKPHRGGRR